jgi:hypothetical protein
MVLGLLAGLTALLSVAANAQVVTTVTSSTDTGITTPSVAVGAPGNPSGPFSYADPNSGDRSGGSFASDTVVGATTIDFQNGSASTGTGISTHGSTTVAITLTNHGAGDVAPVFNSQIVAAGLGFYVANETCGSSLLTAYCGPDALIPGATGSVPSFKQVAAAAPASTTLATTKVDFNVLLNGVSIYDLTADATLATSASGALQFTSDFAQVGSVLTNFRRQYTSDTAFIDSYQWDSTDISLALPTLAAGATDVVDYVTTVTTTSNAGCVVNPEVGCLVSYAAFGDPLGASNGIHPNLAAPRSLAFPLTGSGSSGGLTFGTYQLAKPPAESQNGDIGLMLTAPIATGPVPESATWLLMLCGFGVTGLTLRRRRRSASAFMLVAPTA